MKCRCGKNIVQTSLEDGIARMRNRVLLFHARPARIVSVCQECGAENDVTEYVRRFVAVGATAPLHATRLTS